MFIAKCSGWKNHTGKIIFLMIACSLAGCSHHDDAEQTKSLYRAINKSDTAILKIQLNEKDFNGQLEIYNESSKDSGDVNGVIKGDTLKGTYYFKHDEYAKWERIPIALLKRDQKLIMGVGTIEIYMNMTFFKKTVPINYDLVKYRFEKTK